MKALEKLAWNAPRERIRMKRFIDLRGQTCLDEECSEFAWYDTVIDKFEEFNGTQVWCSVEEFKEDYEGDELDRYLSLIPSSWTGK